MKGTVNGEARGYLLNASTGQFQSDRASEPPLTDATLRALAIAAGQELTYACAPPGSGTRMGIDRDEDGYFDRDELDAGSDPADPKSVPTSGTPLPTVTKTATAQPTVTPVIGICPGDCNHNGVVTIDELIRGVDIALDEQPLMVCANLDTNGDGHVEINELIAAVDAALRGCIFNG